MNVPAQRVSLAWLGNLAVVSTLVVCAVWFARLHAAPWWIAPPRFTDSAIAGSVVLAYLMLLGWSLRPRRGEAERAVATPSIDGFTVVYASQTGFAQVLAERSLEALRAAGLHAHLRALGTLAPDDLRGRMLFVISTTGEGDPPDPAIAFVRNVMSRSPDLHALHYAVLALGDSEYEHFCGFGRQLDDWLRQHGAQPLFDRVEVDNADESALRHWQHHLGQIGGTTDLPDWDAPRYEAWTLIERRLLNPGSLGGPAFHLALQRADGPGADWQAGDIAEIGPRNPPDVIARFAKSWGWSPAQHLLWEGRSVTLGELLSDRHLPAAESVIGQSPEQVVPTLRLLPHREYSIASIAADGRLELLVRLMHRSDGQPGLGSGWLCLHAVPGDAIALRVRRNANFHPPAPEAPLILIGNGTGMAGLRAHLKHRARTGARDNWLIFGERQRSTDFFHQAEIERWQRDEVLSRVDLAFSRDQAQRFYVQDALRLAGDELAAWVQRGASIYVCGSLEGMAPAVDAALSDILGEDTLDALRVGGRYRRDVY